LHRQLQIQAHGLAGTLDEWWPDVARSRWIGGDAEGWERGPYWLDGTVPLSFLLDDGRLKTKVVHWIDQILERQDDEGWLGPVLDSRWSYAYDTWPRFVVLKALTQYHDATGDQRIPRAIERFLHKVDQVLDERPLRSWALYRWADLVLSIHWLYELAGDDWLLDLATKVRAQGFDWQHHFDHFPYYDKCRREECDLRSHGPNNAMAIKTPAVWYRQSGDEADREAVARMISTLDRFHGQATGMFTCDEHLAGRSPSQGSELCAVVVAAISYAPCTVRVEVDDVPLEIEVVTEYPFDGHVRVRVRAERPVRFPLRLRIPTWAEGAEIWKGEHEASPVAAATFHTVEQEWSGETIVYLRFPMPLRIERRLHDSAAIHRGPLLFGLRLDEEFRQIGGEQPHADWEVFSRTPWNYALELDLQRPEQSIHVTVAPMHDLPFSPDGAPVRAVVYGRRLPDWELEHNAAAPVPESPLVSDQPRDELLLIPYGATNLRIAEFPVLAPSEPGGVRDGAE